MRATHSLHPTNYVLMQSAITKIRYGLTISSSSHLVRYTGSQTIFVTQGMKHKLELKTMGKELQDETTFGSFQSSRKTYDIVSFPLSTEKENIKIKALSNSNYLSTAISHDEETSWTVESVRVRHDSWLKALTTTHLHKVSLDRK